MFALIQQKLQNTNRKLILGALGILTISSLVYLHLKRRIVNLKITLQGQSFATSQASNKSIRLPQDSNSPEKKLVKVYNTIKKVFIDKENVTKQALKAIFEGHYELSRMDYKTIILRNRTERRKRVLELRKFQQIVVEEEESIQDLRNKNLDTILANFQISKSEWIKLIETVSQDQKDEWQQMLFDLEASQLDSLRNKTKPQLKLSQLQNIYQYKISELNQLADKVRSEFKEIDPSELFAILEAKINDLTFFKFSIEEQDINYSLNKLTEVERQSLSALEDDLSELFAKIVNGESL